MASKYTQLGLFDTINELYPDSTFLVSRGNWASDDSISGDIFTVLSSYRVPYSHLSNNLRYCIEHAVPLSGLPFISVDNEKWNFSNDGGLRIATNGSLSAVIQNNPMSANWMAAMNLETCRMISSDAWWQIQRKCFDAAHARQMSGMINRLMMEKDAAKTFVNKYHMTAIVYDICSRNWAASEYFRTRGVLTCVNQIDKGKTVVTIKSGSEARVPTLYNLCPFKRWSTLPYDYKPETTAYSLFNVGTTNTLNHFMSCYVVYNRDASEPISYYLIDTLDELSDVKNNIDMSIYDKNRFLSLSARGGDNNWVDSQVKDDGRTYHWKYDTIKHFYQPSNPTDKNGNPITRVTRLADISDHDAFGPSYMGNIYLYPVYEPYTFDLWGAANYGIYRSEPNPCGSKITSFELLSSYSNLFTFNPQQALWEYQRYLNKTGGGSLPGNLHQFFEKFCKIRIYAKRDPAPNAQTVLRIAYDKPPPPWRMASRPDEEFVWTSLTPSNATSIPDTWRSDYMTVSGNGPTRFYFSDAEGSVEQQVRWTIWIDSMVIW